MLSTAKTIILTDDDEDDREIFRTAVESINPEVRLLTFDDGVYLTEYLNSNPALLPHMIFLDINMPRMNGFECLSILRNRFKSTELPVVMYTTSESEIDLMEANRLGANLYVRKPADFKVLKTIIRNLLDSEWLNHSSHYKNFIIKGDDF